MHVDVMMT